MSQSKQSTKLCEIDFLKEVPIQWYFRRLLSIDILKEVIAKRLFERGYRQVVLLMG